jgi:ferredoxin
MKILDFYPANCKNCYKCVRNCSVKAIKMIDVAKVGRNAGKVTGMYPLDSSRVKIYIDDVGLLPNKVRLFYVYTDNKGNEYRIEPDCFLCFP